MSRPIAKYALLALVLLTILDVDRTRIRAQSAKSAHKEALMTWEDEGGALPA